jgi:hypothetical protein
MRHSRPRMNLAKIARALAALVIFVNTPASTPITLAAFSAAAPAASTATPAATCAADIGPGIPPPSRVAAGLPGFHAAWYGQSGYMRLCPGGTATATLAYYNSGSRGWVSGRMGEVAYLGTWASEPGQDQPSILGGDGQLGSPSTGWPRYNRIAVQPAPYVGPGQVAWFQFAVRAPANPGTYRLFVRPLIEGAQWLEDIGVFWQVTVLNPDGTPPRATPPDPAGLTFRVDPGVYANDIALVHQGVQHVSAYLDANAGGARRSAATVHVYVGDGTQRYCCLTFGDSYEIVTSNAAWSSPPAAAADTWTPDTERTELAAHEYVHLWQYAVGGSACMVGVRWIAEGMAESFAYRALVADGLIPQANMDTFTKRQLRTATQQVTLRSLETSWPLNANPFAVSYLAVDRLLAAKGLLAIRDWCSRVGAGQDWRQAFAVAFGETTDAFYARFESFRAEYLR